jgi:uncharacterized protein (DUF58 family)
MQSIFFHFYRWTTAAKFWLFRRILPAGWGVLISGVISATMLMGSPLMPLYQMFALLFGLSSIALIWTWARRASLSAQRELPSHAAVGQELRYTVTVFHQGGTLTHASLLETAPDPRPTLPVFLASREPGEDLRNGFDRFFAFNRWQWLIEKGTRFCGGRSNTPLFCETACQCRTTLSITPQKRGCIVMQDMRVLLPDPFSFFQRARRVKTSTDHLIVLPRRYRLPPFRLPGSSHYHAGDDAASREKGNSGEFTSLREYRTGDPPRMIHWKSWAKQGKPIVKEVEDVVFPRYALVLDTFAIGNEQEFEEAVSVAASFVAEIDTEEVMLDLMFLGDNEQVITAGRDLAGSMKLLEALSGVNAAATENFKGLSRLIARHSGDLSACICVFTGWSDARAAFLRSLDTLGLNSISLAIETPKSSLPGRVHALRPHRVQEDLMRWRG